MNKGIEFLKANESAIPSKFEEKAQWRRENRQWLLWSRSFKSVAELETKLGVQFLDIVEPAI